MRFPKKIGVVLLAFWLIASGLLTLLPSLSFAESGRLLALLAIATGIFLFLER